MTPRTLEAEAAAAHADLRESERRAARALDSGREEVFGDDPPLDAPDDAAIRAEVLRWLLIHAGGSGTTGSGLRLRGFRIAGDFVLDGLKLDFPILLSRCALGHIALRDAGLATLHLNGSHCTKIMGDRMTVERGVVLGDGFRCDGLVWLPDAAIRGDLNCGGGWFCNPGGQAVLLDGARIGGRLFLRDGRFAGAVHAINATIDGGVSANDARFTHPDDVALNLERLRARGFISFVRAHVEGMVVLSGASTDSDLNLRGLKVRNAPRRVAADLDRCTAGGRVVLMDADLAGGVHLRNASIGKTLECSGAKIDGLGGRSLGLAGATLGGRVVLRNRFTTKGRVTLTATAITGDVSMDSDSSIDGGDGPGLQLNRARVRGNIELGGRIAGRPAANLTGTEAGGDIDLRSGRLVTGNEAPDNYDAPVSLRGEGLSVAGSLLAAGLVTVKGEVRLPRSTIGGDVDFSHATLGARLVLGSIRVRGRLLLEGTTLPAFSMTSGDIGGRFRWNVVGDCAGAKLTHSTVGYLDDTSAAWPASGLDLDGFMYGGLDRVGTVADRLGWIRGQTTRAYSPRPYEQLIAVLRRDGHEKEAREVARHKRSDLRKYGNLGRLAGAGNWLLGVLLGYGYQVWRALVPALALVIVGGLLFDPGDMIEVRTGNAPGFHSFAYSVDALLPVINLHQEDYRLPRDGTFEDVYLWFHIAAGWALTTLIALGLTSLVRRD